MSTLHPTLETYMNTIQESPLCAHITPENLSLFLSHANVKVQSFKKTPSSPSPVILWKALASYWKVVLC